MTEDVLDTVLAIFSLAVERTNNAYRETMMGPHISSERTGNLIALMKNNIYLAENIRKVVEEHKTSEQILDRAFGEARKTAHNEGRTVTVVDFAEQLYNDYTERGINCGAIESDELSPWTELPDTQKAPWLRQAERIYDAG